MAMKHHQIADTQTLCYNRVGQFELTLKKY